MTSSIPHIQAAPITEDYPALFGDSYEIYATYEEHDAIFYPRPDPDTIPPLQEAAYEGPSNGHGNWLGDHDSSCFCGSWGDDSFFSYSYDSDINGISSSMVKAEEDDHHQTQVQYESDFSYHEDSENQSTFDYNACYDDSHFAYTESEREVRPAYSYYGLDEMRFFEGIFGYWPCLFREVQRAYVEQ
ncbi:hypothetical protein ACOSQ4_030208 [Xanthoceras sorbifolium]